MRRARAARPREQAAAVAGSRLGGLRARGWARRPRRRRDAALEHGLRATCRGSGTRARETRAAGWGLCRCARVCARNLKERCMHRRDGDLLEDDGEEKGGQQQCAVSDLQCASTINGAAIAPHLAGGRPADRRESAPSRRAFRPGPTRPSRRPPGARWAPAGGAVGDMENWVGGSKRGSALGSIGGRLDASEGSASL